MAAAIPTQARLRMLSASLASKALPIPPTKRVKNPATMPSTPAMSAMMTAQHVLVRSPEEGTGANLVIEQNRNRAFAK
jgi:hypothetical protein